MPIAYVHNMVLRKFVGTPCADMYAAVRVVAEGSGVATRHYLGHETNRVIFTG